jgi:hypothetical protein
VEIFEQSISHEDPGGGEKAPHTPPGGLEPIAGVTLEQYVRVVKAIAPLGDDPSLLKRIAASQGLDGPTWQRAHAGWNERIQSDPAVARAFSGAYRAI